MKIWAKVLGIVLVKLYFLFTVISVLFNILT